MTPSTASGFGASAHLNSVADLLQVRHESEHHPIGPRSAARRRGKLVHLVHAHLQHLRLPPQLWILLLNLHTRRTSPKSRPGPGRRLPLLKRPQGRDAATETSQFIIRTLLTSSFASCSEKKNSPSCFSPSSPCTSAAPKKLLAVLGSDSRQISETILWMRVHFRAQPYLSRHQYEILFLVRDCVDWDARQAGLHVLWVVAQLVDRLRPTLLSKVSRS
jgi:hypothetical protein